MDQIHHGPHRGNMGRNGDLTTTLGPRTREIDNLISQSPNLPPLYPGWGVVGHNIDRRIMHLSILCPTTPVRAEGGQHRGFDQRRLPL